MKPAPYYTQAGLAKAAGTTRYNVHKSISRGLLKTTPTLDGLHIVSKAEAERWMRSRRAKPKPKPK